MWIASCVTIVQTSGLELSFLWTSEMVSSWKISLHKSRAVRLPPLIPDIHFFQVLMEYLPLLGNPVFQETSPYVKKVEHLDTHAATQVFQSNHQVVYKFCVISGLIDDKKVFLQAEQMSSLLPVPLHSLSFPNLYLQWAGRSEDSFSSTGQFFFM